MQSAVRGGSNMELERDKGELQASAGRVRKVLQKALEERGHGMRVMFDVTMKDAYHSPRQA
jgi:hypothetical protein